MLRLIYFLLRSLMLHLQHPDPISQKFNIIFNLVLDVFHILKRNVIIIDVYSSGLRFVILRKFHIGHSVGFCIA